MGAKKLMQDIDTKFKTWNERSQFQLMGVGNLSVSDMDTLKLYAETYLQYGYYYNLMNPLGSIEKILKLYGLP